MRMTRKGMSIIEMLLVLFILALLSGSIFSMFVNGKTIYYASLTRSSARQDLQVVFWQIERELRDSNLATLNNCTSGGPSCPGGSTRAFSFSSGYDNSGNFITDATTGAAIWQKYVVYCVPSGSTMLFRKEESLGTSLTDQINHCVAQGKRVSSGVTSLLLTPNFTNASVTIYLTTQNTNILGKIDQQSRDFTLFLRN